MLVEQFLAAHDRPPRSITLHVDASDLPLHGRRKAHSIRASTIITAACPYVLCGKHLLASYLRKSRIDGARHVSALIKRQVARIRANSPHNRIIIRGNFGFCRQRLLHLREANALYYVISLSRNARPERAVTTDKVRLLPAFGASSVKIA